MITNVPTPGDFSAHGIMFLNFAWDAVFGLFSDYKDAEDFNAIWDKQQTDDYWRAAKRPLSIAHALAQQGAELVLKSQIAAQSPYLLLSASPREWPKSCDKQDTSFADFRTIDSQDLIRVCNTVCTNPLSEQLVTTFDRFRKQRNSLLHTVDNRLDFPAKEIVEYVLDTAHLIAPPKWPSLRHTYLAEQPVSHLHDVDCTMNRLGREMEQMIELVDRGKLLSLFGFDKNHRRYICPSCYDGCEHDYDPDFYPRTAQLQPNTPESTNVHCFVCGEDTSVTRKKCDDNQCKGNVIRTGEWPMCLTCSKEQEEAN
jgi:hypothetical protein